MRPNLLLSFIAFVPSIKSQLSNTTCLNITRKEANTFVDRFARVFDHADSDLGDWNKTATMILSTDFVFASNSFLTRHDTPLGNGSAYGIVVTNRDDFIELMARNTVSGVTPLDTLVDCDKIAWRANLGSTGEGEYPSKVLGIMSLKRESTPNGYGGQGMGALLGTKWEAEYDSIGWSKGEGLDCGSCVVKRPQGYGG